MTANPPRTRREQRGRAARAPARTPAPADRDDRPPANVPPTGRHPGDGLRVGLGLLVLLVTLLAVQRDRLTLFEADLFRLVNDLPDQLAVVLGPVMQAGNVLAAPVLGVVALLATRRHLRVALDVTGAGVLAWFAAKVVKDLVGRPRPLGFIEDAARIGATEGLGFVSGHTAVAAAIVTAAAPYLPRRVRRVLWLLPWAVGFARIYYGAHLPLDVLGGAALGWAVGAAVHVLFGAPHRIPGLDEAARVLRRAGMRPTALHRVGGTPRGSFPFVADTEQGTVFVKLLDPETRDHDRLYRVARFLAFRDARDETAVLDTPSQAHREAAMTLLARERGVRVPAVRGIESDRDRAWIVQEHVSSSDLEQLPPEHLTDELLDALWAQARLLRAGRIAHRDLVASNILVDTDRRPWIVDFAHARTSTRTQPLDNDVAEMLVTTAFAVGVDRAVASACRALGAGVLRRAQPELQPLVLTAEARHRLRDEPGLLPALRAAVGEQAGVDAAGPAASSTGGLRTVALLLGSLGVLTALVVVPSPAAVVEAVVDVGWRWLGVAVLAVVASVAAGAWALLAAIDRGLAVGRTSLLRLTEQGCEAAGGRGRGHAHVVRRLGRSGVPPFEAEAGLTRLGRVRGLVLVTAAAGLAAWAVRNGGTAELFAGAGWLAVIALAAVALELTVLGRGRAPVGRTQGPAMTPSTQSAVRLVVAAAVALVTAAVSTAAVAEAVGDGPAVMGVALVHVLAVALGAILPARGASGVVTVALASGLAALGMPLAAAVATALLARLLQFWLPAAVGAALHDRWPPAA